MRYTHSEIAEEARRVDRLHRRVHMTGSIRNQSRKEHREHQAACKDFHAADSFFEELMGRKFLDRVIAEDGDERETAIVILEADPCCYRSGYLKGKLIQALRQVELTSLQSRRLRIVIAKMATASPRVGFRDYCRLALKVADDELYQIFSQLASDDSLLVRNRTKRMLQYLEQQGGFDPKKNLR